MKTPSLKKSVQSFLLVSAAYLAVPAQAAVTNNTVPAQQAGETTVQVATSKRSSSLSESRQTGQSEN